MARIVKDYKNVRCSAMIEGKVCHFESLLEYRWAQVLEFYITAGLIARWEYETSLCRFNIGPLTYILDFVTITPSGFMEWYECKGYVERRDVTRFRRIAEAYPKCQINLVVDHIPKRRAQNIWSAKKYVYRIIEAGRIFKQIPVDMARPPSIADHQPGRGKGAL